MSCYTVPETRRAVLGAVLSAAVGGLLFGPAFGSLSAVAWPVLAVAAVTYAGYEVAVAAPWLRPARVVLTLVGGVLAAGAVLTTVTVDALRAAVTRSWLLTLQSTSPASPDPEHTSFVPLAVLFAALLGSSLALRRRGLWAVAPGVGLAVTAEAFHPLSLTASAVGVVALLAAASAAGGPRPSLRPVVVLAVTTFLGASVAGFVDPAAEETYSLRDHVRAAPAPSEPLDPLDEIAERLEHPDTPVFSVRTAGASTDLWPVAVLDRFDGRSWSRTGRLRRLGAGIDTPAPTDVPVRRGSAAVLVDALPGPYLPTQHGLTDLTPGDGDLQPLVDESDGTVLARHVRPYVGYRLRWAAPQVGKRDLTDARLDTGGAALATQPEVPGRVPGSFRAVLRKAIGASRPSVDTALLLERYLRRHCSRATGTDLPSGNGWDAITRFLAPGTSGDSTGNPTACTGTSEQFAAAYVALARLAGIPARLVVGYRQPVHAEPDGSFIVRNGDAMAWPEIPVRGIGWVPMDPMPKSASGDVTSMTRATDRARATLPSAVPPVPPAPGASASGPSLLESARGWMHALGVLLLVAAIALLLAIPAGKYARGLARRRRDGSAAVLAAWCETCDLLLDHGVPLTRGMTVRDIAASVTALVDSAALRALEDLVDLVDEAVWSGDTARPHAVAAAWQAADDVRRSLARWPLLERVAAGLAVRSLRPDRPPLRGWAGATG